MGRCKHTDCRYRMPVHIAEEDGPCCDYFGQTGQTRLGQIYKEHGFTRRTKETRCWTDPARCSLYEPAAEVGEDAGLRDNGPDDRTNDV